MTLPRIAIPCMAMKMTMHIDEAILAEAIEKYGFDSKTEAVNAALWEMVRRARLKEFAENGLGFSPEELKDSVDPAYDLSALRLAESPP